MTAQTSYDLNTGRAYSGQVANIQDSNIVTAIVETGPILPGIFVQRVSAGSQYPAGFNGSVNNAVAVGGGAAADNFGIAVRDLGRENAANAAEIAYNDTDQFPVMRAGYINVTIPSGGSAGDPVYFNDTTGVVDAGTTGAGFSTIDGARLETDTTAGQVGLIWIPNVITVTAGSTNI